MGFERINLPQPTEEENVAFPTFIYYLNPGPDVLHARTLEYKTGKLKHIRAIVCAIQAQFPDTDTLFQAALTAALGQSYLERDVVVDCLSTDIINMKHDPNNQRIVDAMQFALTLLTASTGNDQEGLAR